METLSTLLAICAGNSLVTSEFPAKRPVTWNFNGFYDLHWINGWVNNREAGDLRHHCAHYDVTVMMCHLVVIVATILVSCHFSDCSSFEDKVPIEEIYIWALDFKWVSVIRLKDCSLSCGHQVRMPIVQLVPQYERTSQCINGIIPIQWATFYTISKLWGTISNACVFIHSEKKICELVFLFFSVLVSVQCIITVTS